MPPPRKFLLIDDAGQPHVVHVVWREMVRRHGTAIAVWSRSGVILADGGAELIEERSGGRWRAMFSKFYYNGQIPHVLES